MKPFLCLQSSVTCLASSYKTALPLPPPGFPSLASILAVAVGGLPGAKVRVNQYGKIKYREREKEKVLPGLVHAQRFRLPDDETWELRFEGKEGKKRPQKNCHS